MTLSSDPSDSLASKKTSRSSSPSWPFSPLASPSLGAGGLRLPALLVSWMALAAFSAASRRGLPSRVMPPAAVTFQMSPPALLSPPALSPASEVKSSPR